MSTYPQNISFGSYGGGGYGGGSPFSMSYPAPQQGGGGGWLGNILGTVGGGLMGTNPLGLGIMAGGQILSGLLGGLFAGGKQKKKEKWFAGQQKGYQDQMNRLFPELSKESFQYQDPALNNAIQGALGYRLGNMFGDWGMPAGRTQGMGSLNSLFAALMPGGGGGGQMPPMPMPQQPMPMPQGGGYGGGFPGRGMMGPGGGPGGWMGDLMPPQQRRFGQRMV